MEQTTKQQVVINVLTKAQYDATTKNEGELYFVTDETPATISDEQTSTDTTWSSAKITEKINEKLGAIDELLDIIVSGNADANN